MQYTCQQQAERKKPFNTGLFFSQSTYLQFIACKILQYHVICNILHTILYYISPVYSKGFSKKHLVPLLFEFCYFGKASVHGLYIFSQSSL